ncbi:hypothetical protein PVAP13_9NG478114 [Panicum virgatum]|uniref:Uncharacterized protein n=1 Tax=Panicum virgatum TaxID=38727 RepID=A0A8T0MTM3_PANVG|nr:hypothetical protein PVAP13_9NG478114 [Panicum virgatum]
MLVQRHTATICRLREKRASFFITIGFEFCSAAIKRTGQGYLGIYLAYICLCVLTQIASENNLCGCKSSAQT